MRQANHPANKPQTRKRLKLLSGVLALLTPMLASALEIGVPTSNPILGHSLRLEIPLTVPAGGKIPHSDCARLVQRPDDADGDYFPRETHITIAPRRGGAMLIVTSSRGIASPVVGFRLLVGCETGVSRDFMLLASQQEITAPANRAAVATPEAAAETKPAGHPANAGEMVVTHDTTLNKLARARYPANRETRDAYRRLMAEANPELFANGGDHVGSIPVPAGTTLKIPAGLPRKEALLQKGAAEHASDEVPQAGSATANGGKTDAAAQTQAASGEPKSPRTAKKADRLVIGGGQGRVPSLSQQELKQSLDRLEQMMTDKSRGDIAMSETLTSLAASFGEVKTYLQGVDERIKHAEAEQMRAQAELQSLREELRSSYSLVELLLAIVGGGAIGASLIMLVQRFTARPQPTPFGNGAALAASAAPPAPPEVPPAQPGKAATTLEKPVSTAVQTPTPRASRVEPTTQHSSERAAGVSAKAAPETIPDRFAALKKPTADTAAETPSSPAAVTPQETTAADTKFEIELPQAGSGEAGATSAPGIPAASSLQLPAVESSLELKLGSGDTDLAETPVPGSHVDPVLELADVMTSLGLAKEAASAVIEHIRQHPHQDPSHWFKVLEIYRSTGHREAFDEAVQELRQNLNVAIDDWETDPEKRDRTSLENYPHLSRELQALWPKPECDEFLTKLLEDNRGGKRAGFPQSVAEEIVLLKAILRNAPHIDFPPIAGADNATEGPDLAESKAWLEVRLIP